MSEPYVTATLAHPLDADVAFQVGLERKPYPVGAEITLLRREAQRLVAAGLIAGADPTDPASVNRALKVVKKPGSATSAPSQP